MKNKNKWMWIAASLFVCLINPLMAQSIAEKKANLKAAGSDLDHETDRMLLQVNEEAQDIHAQIQRLYEAAFRLYQENASPDEYRALLDQINDQKQYLLRLENSWRDIAAKGNRVEGYGLWHAPETSLEQLVIDYGSQDYVYLIPPDVGSIKLSIASNLPIPRSSWNNMLEHILSQNGVGIRSVNPYLRQLYLIKQSNAHLRLITNNRCDLEALPSDARVSFVLSPEPAEVRRTYLFLDKFINPNNTVLQVLGRDILLIGQASDIQDLLKLCDFVATNRGDKEYRLIPVYKTCAEEMARILAAMFDQQMDDNMGPPMLQQGDPNQAPPPPPFRNVSDSNGLKIIVLNNLAQALFIVGTKEEIRKAEEIVCNVESQIGGAREKTAFWYTVKHSEPEELADVLYRIYLLMVNTGADMPPGAWNGPDGGGMPPGNFGGNGNAPTLPPVPAYRLKIRPIKKEAGLSLIQLLLSLVCLFKQIQIKTAIILLWI